MKFTIRHILLVTLVIAFCCGIVALHPDPDKRRYLGTAMVMLVAFALAMWSLTRWMRP